MPDLILHNAHVVTMDPRMPHAKAVVVDKGRISSVSDIDDSMEMEGEATRIIDCGGRTLLPGFIDAHCHLRAYAVSLITLDLRPETGVFSIRDIQTKIQERTRNTPAGGWIRAQGYHEFDLAERRHPNRWDLDAVSPAHPVKIAHRSGHAHVLNSAAMRLVGLSRHTPDPEGGVMERDLETGEPTGVLYEMGDLIAKRIPRMDDREMEQGVREANRCFLSFGITSVYDASSKNGRDQWEKAAEWKERGLVLSRVGMFFSPSFTGKVPELSFSGGTDSLRPLGVKIILDETTGELFPSQRELNWRVLEAHRHGLQVAVHSVEKPAIESACIALEEALAAFPRAGHRHRLEHCFLCPKSLVERLASVGAFVVTQPAFIYQNGDRYLTTVPQEDRDSLYPIRSLMEAGVPTAAGSDCPVGPVNPFLGLYAAITRRTRKGRVVREREEISLQDALALYTSAAAKSGFEEGSKGSIIPGKAADLILLSQRLPERDTEALKEISVEATLIGGEIVWERTT